MQSPLIWAIKSGKKIETIQFLMERYTKAQKDAKDSKKDMAIHHLCRYGVSPGEDADAWLKLFVEHKAKFSQASGFDKYTPLTLAASKGRFEIV